MHNIIPCNDVDIDKLNKSNEFKQVLSYLYDNFYTIYNENWIDSLPITVNDKSNVIKLRRRFKLTELIERLTERFDLFKVIMNRVSITIKYNNKIILKIEEGEGSRNNKAGGGKKGKDFEDDLALDILNYKNNTGVIKYPNIMNMLYGILKSDYSLDLIDDDYDSQVDGGLNQKRKPHWSAEGGMCFDPQENIGSIVTDLTITHKDRNVYLSLKFSSEFYILNASIRKHLYEHDINRNVAERNDIAKYFGFNPIKFYTPYGVTSTEDVEPDIKTVKWNWENTLSGAIGYGYIYIVGGRRQDIVINSISPPTIKVINIGEPLYAIQGKRKYSKMPLEITINEREYNIDCQFRGTKQTDILPYYMRVLVKK